MIGQFVDTMILASTGIEWLWWPIKLISLEKYWKLLPATLTQMCEFFHARQSINNTLQCALRVSGQKKIGVGYFLGGIVSFVDQSIRTA